MVSNHSIFSSLITLGLVVVGAAIPAGGCLDEAIDCRQVCSAYADCFDMDYDVRECAEECREQASDDEDFDRRLESCESCIEGQSCASAAFQCTDDCIGIVP